SSPGAWSIASTGSRASPRATTASKFAALRTHRTIGSSRCAKRSLPVWFQLKKVPKRAREDVQILPGSSREGGALRRGVTEEFLSAERSDCRFAALDHLLVGRSPA